MANLDATLFVIPPPAILTPVKPANFKKSLRLLSMFLIWSVKLKQKNGNSNMKSAIARTGPNLT
jgi:hypothetical protein